MKLVIKIFLIVFTVHFFFSCDSTEPPPPPETKPTLTLELDDVSCIEAWLQLKTKDLELPAELTLKQYNPTGDSVSHIFLLNTQDSLLYIDSLLPNQNYSFQISSILPQVSSAQQPVTTMDTTSHNFTFQSWTFGTIGSSTLYDVAIINENNIWAVGEIMIADTSQNGYTTYNAVHWDGNEWELKQIPYYYNGQVFYHPIQSVFSFSENDIMFCGNGIINWDGANFRSIGISSGVWGPYQMNKMWGISSNDFYIVGTNGQIAHYNGTNWQRIESGTTLIIGDIWGITDNNKKYLAADNFMLIIDSTNQVQRLASANGLSSIWGINENLIYAAGGSGLYKFKNYDWEKVQEQGTIRIVRGSNYNDVYGLGNSIIGEISHFNGYSWGSISVGTLYTNYSLSVKQNSVATVGWNGDKALITLLFRN
ncbi:MAG: glucosyl transferase [Ignavibacteriota bacterium]